MHPHQGFEGDSQPAVLHVRSGAVGLVLAENARDVPQDLVVDVVLVTDLVRLQGEGGSRNSF